MVKLLDTTLRDGGNVVGHGFPIALTLDITRELLACGIVNIELGNCKGLGAWKQLGAHQAPSDAEYLNALQPYVSRGNIGMFLMASCAQVADIQRAGTAGLSFLRVGANAGEGSAALPAIRLVKEAGLICRFSMMKAYIATPQKLAEEAAALEAAGVDCITIMDSAGTMLPAEVQAYVTALKNTVRIPVGFHGHNNLGLSQANALAAVEAGADEIDCGLMGMARSAGNCATELAVATLQREGHLPEVDLFRLLDYIDEDLMPIMEHYGYRPAVDPTELVLGLYGCHSGSLSLIKRIAGETGVPLRKLIAAVSAKEKKTPGEVLIFKTARQIREQR